MPTVTFIHPRIDKTLSVETGADNIEWNYNLITQTYPTYAGEVVQVLGVHIDTLRIGGTLSSYAKMEEIYAWFAQYFSLATQGYHVTPATSGTDAYNEEPVVMFYPERGWRIPCQPLSVPGFRYGSDVVAPTWRMEASVWEPDTEQMELTLQAAVTGVDGIRTQDWINAGIGFTEDNPFSTPTKNGKPVTPKKGDLDHIVDWFQNIVTAYNEGDASSLVGAITGSGPANTTPKADPDSKSDAQHDQNKTKPQEPDRATTQEKPGKIRTPAKGGKGTKVPTTPANP